MKKKQKKLFIFNPSIEDGGVEKNLYIISNYLCSKINSINLICSNPDKKNKFDKKINFIFPKFKFFYNQKRPLKYFICLILLIKNIIKYKKNILVFSFQANIYAVIVCKLFGVKIITRSNTSSQGWSRNYLKNLLFRFFLKKADHIIANSKIFKKELEKKFNVKVSCIYNPLKKNEIINLSKEKLSFPFFEKKGNEIKILNIGRLTDQKDQETLIRAVNRINKDIPFKLAILGKGINNSKLQTLINYYNLNNKVKLAGYNKNPYKYINSCDLFILSSKFEGLPNVLIESLLLKKYIISSNCPTGPKEIIKNNKFGDLFKVGDDKALSKLIINFFFNKKKLEKKIILGYKSLNRFNYSSNCEKYYKTVKKFL